MSLLKYASESQLNIQQIFCYRLLETLVPSTNLGMVAVSFILFTSVNVALPAPLCGLQWDFLQIQVDSRFWLLKHHSDLASPAGAVWD